MTSQVCDSLEEGDDACGVAGKVEGDDEEVHDVVVLSEVLAQTAALVHLLAFQKQVPCKGNMSLKLLI